jgi:hypothetical protein
LTELIKRPDVEQTPSGERSKIRTDVHVSCAGNRQALFVPQYRQRFIERRSSAHIDVR